MTTRINIQPVPNQSLSIPLDDRQYNIAIKEINGSMAVDIERDNQIVIQGHRVAAGTPLIPYRYLESGNFIFTTRNGEQPYYTKFAESQALIYASPDELEALRATPATPTFPTPERIVRPIFYAPLTNDLRYTGAGVITFARNSIATGVRNGVLSQVAVNTPRFEDEGLLIEGASTNHVSTFSFGGRGGTQNTGQPDPLGGNRASILSQETEETDGRHIEFIYSNFTQKATDTVSVFLRKTDGSTISRLEIRGWRGGEGSNSDSESLTIRWVDGVLTPPTGVRGTFSVVPFNNGWFRLIYTHNLTDLNPSTFRRIRIYAEGRNAGGGVSTEVALCQVTALNFPSSYIPTTGAALTRPADVLTIPTGISQTGDATVFIVVRENGSSESFPDIWRVLLGRGTRLEARGSAPIGRVLFHALPNISIILTTDSFNTHVYAISRSGMTYRAYTDGVFINQMTTDTAVTPQTPVIGGSDGFFGNVRDLAVYDRTLSDVEIMRISRQMLERTFSG